MSYWKIAPGERAGNWDIQRDSGYIGIGWPQIGNVLECTKQEYDRKREEQARLLQRKAFDGHRNVWTFIHSIAIGDIIVANRGIHLIVGIGIVTGNAKYVVDSNSEFPNRRTVDWKYINSSGLLLPSAQFTQATVTKISNPDWISFSQDLLKS